MNGRRTCLASVLVAVVFLLGCGTTERDWKQATANKTVAAYKDFIAKHPSSAHVVEANAAIDDLDWSAAKSANTAQAFNDFTAAHPQSPRASEAQAQAETLDWNGLKGAKALDSYIDFYKHYPRSTRLEKLTGDIEGSPAVSSGPLQGMVFTVRGNVPVGHAIAMIKVNGGDIGFQISAEDAGRLGLIEYRSQGKTAYVDARALKNSTITILRGPDKQAGIVDVSTAGNQIAK